MPDHLTDLELLLLLSVVRLPEGAHAGAIQEELERNARRHVSLGSIHVTLGRLEEQGLVRSRKGSPRARQGGKARRLYRVTEEGREAMEHTRAVFERMWKGVAPEGSP